MARKRPWRVAANRTSWLCMAAVLDQHLHHAGVFGLISKYSQVWRAVRSKRSVHIRSGIEKRLNCIRIV